MLHLVHTLTLNNFFFDILNYFFVLAIFFLFYKYKFISLPMLCALSFSALGPFLINNFVMNWGFMPDQAKYFRQSQLFRHLDFVGYDKDSVVFPSGFFSFIPLPFIETINSIGFINKLILGIFTILLFHNKIIDKLYFYFLNFFPSIYLYSSLSLKETLVLIISLMIAYNIVRHKGYIFNILTIIPLCFVKLLNTVIIIPIFFFYNLIIIKKAKTLNILIFICALLYVIIYYDDMLTLYNKHRFSFYFEAHNTFEEIYRIELNLISFLNAFKEALHFIVSPLLNLDSFFKLFQVLENLFIYTYISVLLYQLYGIDKLKSYFWLTTIILTSLFYGNLIFDDGTIARYRFVILVFFNFVLFLEVKNVKKNK